MIERNKKSRIPDFATREEEAAFWDSHDIADYEDELKPVKVRFGKKLSEGFTVRFDLDTLDIMGKRSPWHSVKQSTYHNNSNCNTGNNIERENVRQGTGGKRLCAECAALNRAGR